ncbi:MAG TPA: DUF4124 domain-containing protein [Burkholderiales bacterium]|nr:DUF4124 domain-containing protein [Burkholderiales bacterium]
MRRATISLAVIGLLCAYGPVHAQSKGSSSPTTQKLYKWVDDQGKVHYTERLPPEATGKATAQMNRQGTVVKEMDRALTKEEQLAKQEAERKREEDAKRATEERRMNEAILSSYSSEKDIDMARERAMQSNADAIKSAMHNVETAKKLQAELKQKTAPFKDKSLPLKLQRDIESNEVDLRNQQQLLDSKTLEAAKINARYDEDKRRYIALTRGGPVSAAPPTSTPAPTATR